MADIFISYAQGDREWVKTLATALEAEGFAVWWDPELLPGTRFREIIKQELTNAGAMIVVWSHLSVGSDWVLGEADEARTLRKLIPVLREAIRPPTEFRGIQTADLSQWRGRPENPEFQRVVRAVKALVPQAPAPVPAADGAVVPTPPPRPLPEPIPRPAYRIAQGWKGWIAHGWKRWFSPHGRSTKVQFGLQMLTALAAFIAIGQLSLIAGPDHPGYSAAIVLIGIPPLIIFVVLAHARRLHDLNVRGLWALPVVLTSFPMIISIPVLCVLRGTPGDNKYGIDPTAGRS